MPRVLGRFGLRLVVSGFASLLLVVGAVSGAAWPSPLSVVSAPTAGTGIAGQSGAVAPASVSASASVAGTTYGSTPSKGKYPCATVTPLSLGTWASSGDVSFRETVVSIPAHGEGCFPPINVLAWCLGSDGTPRETTYGDGLFAARLGETHDYTDHPCSSTETLRYLEIIADGSNAPAYYNGDALTAGLVWGEWPVAPSNQPTAAEQGGAPPWLETFTSCLVGDPVNCASGALVEAHTDAAIPGRGVGLAWSRTYVSSRSTVDGPLGFGWSFDAAAHLSVAGNGAVTVTDGGGAPTLFTRATDGSFSAPARVRAALAQAGTGAYTLTRFRSHQAMVFGLAGVLSRVSDLNGDGVDYSYDGSGHLAQLTDGANRHLVIGWTGNHITTVTDPMSRVTTYSYNAAGELQSVTDPAGRVTTYGYDSSHQLTSAQDPRGGNSITTYTAGQVTRQVDPAGRATTYQYSGDPAKVAGSTTTTTDSHGLVTTRVYSTMMLQYLSTAVGTGQQATTQYEYDPLSLGVTAQIDSTGRTARHTFDAHGNTLSGIDPLGLTTTFTYDALDHLSSVVRPSGATTTSTYRDTNGNLTPTLRSITDPLNHTTIYAYGDAAHPSDVTSVTDPDGRTVSRTYDAAGDVATTSTSPTATTTNTAESSYDADGELVCREGAVKRATGTHCPTPGSSTPAGATSATYNADGQISTTTDSLGQTTSSGYDANGNHTTFTDARGLLTTTAFDPDNRATSVTAGTGTATPLTSQTTYDIPIGTGTCTATIPAAVSCHSVTDAAGAITTWYETATGKTAATARPGGHLTTIYGYDLADRLLATTTPDGAVTTNTYDDNDRATSRSYSSGQPGPVTYQYDSDGHRVSMVDPTGTTTYTYDPAGRMTATTSATGGTIGYGYDNAGHTATITYPDHRLVQRTFDGAGQITAINDGATPTAHSTTFGYDADGNPITAAYPNATTTTTTFNTNDAAASTTLAGSSGALASLTWQRNPNAQVTSETGTGAAASSATYSYDTAGRLNSTDGNTFAYNGSGGSTTLGSTTQTLTSDGQITGSVGGSAVSSHAYSYNANGARTKDASDATTSYAYDQSSRMTSSKLAMSPASGGKYEPLTPARLLDTRTGAGGVTGPVAATGTFAVQFAGVGGIPTSGVEAVALNVTDVSPAAAGSLTVFPTGTTRPNASSLNWSANQTVANMVIVPVGTNGQLSFYNGSTGTVQFLADVAGYYTTGDTSGGGSFVPVTATRLLDTRNGTGGTTGPVANTTAIQIPVTGHAGVPATGVSAVTVNLTALNGTTNGAAALYPAGTATPNTSNLNWNANAVVPNVAIVKIGTNGAITLKHNSTGTAQFLLDITGYYTAGTPSNAGAFIPVNVNRVVTSAPTASGAIRAVPIAGTTGIPTTGVSAVVVQLTAITTASNSGFLVATPSDNTATGTSNLQYTAGGLASSLAIVKVGADGAIAIKNGGTCAANLWVDIYGYYTAPPGVDGTTSPTTTYTYNGDGLRTTKTTGTTTQNFTYNTTTTAAPTLLSDGVTDYIYGPDGRPLEDISTTNTSPRYYLHDQHGDTRLLTNSTGTIVVAYRYTPYGAAIRTAGTDSTPLLYGGGYTDASTGLIYLINRYYDPATAQFTTVDPAINYTGTPYNYANGDPLNATDPLGLYTCDANTRSALMIGANIAFAAGMFIPGWDLGPDEALWAALDGAEVAGEGGALAVNAAKTESSVATAARSCLNSFTGVTPVTMADGSRKPISKVKVGDKVLATDPETGETKGEPVVQLIRHSGEHGMVLVRLADGSVLDSTDGHPIWDATAGQFTEASKLRIGDTIETTNGAQLTIAGLTTYDADLTAYNLQIDEIHTYYAGATPVLVHNSCGYTPAGGFAGSDIEEVGQSVYQHIGAGDIPGRPGLTQIMDALTRGTPQSLKQGDGSIAQMIDHEGVRVIINEDSPWRSTAFFPGQ